VNGGKLSPVEFREQLRQSFHLHLTRGEVASLIHHFDEDDDGSIDCDEFIRSFYRIGYEEREKFYHKHIQRTRKRQQQELLRQQKRDEYYLQKTILNLPDDSASASSSSPSGSSITDEKREKVFQKLIQIAINYERKQHWGNAFLPFDAISLPPTQFREILKQQFLVTLTPLDLVVLLEEFGVTPMRNSLSRDGRTHTTDTTDTTNTTTTTTEKEINCKEFLSYFFHTGREEKEKKMREKLSLDDKLNRIQRNYEKKLSKTLLDRKITAIEWPILPEISLGRGGGGGGGGGNAGRSSDEDGRSGVFSTGGSQSLSTLSLGGSEDDKYDNSSYSSMLEHDSISTHLSPSLHTSQKSSNRMYRKPSVLDVISPNRLALELIKGEGSFIDAYPNASDDTKVRT
jgi:hypothetical protein